MYYMIKTKTKKPGKKIYKKVKKMTAMESYRRDRDKFFKDHPNARVLLAVFVVSFAIYMALIFTLNY